MTPAGTIIAHNLKQILMIHMYLLQMILHSEFVLSPHDFIMIPHTCLNVLVYNIFIHIHTHRHSYTQFFNAWCRITEYATQVQDSVNSCGLLI
jgi:hypothetical protein